METKSKIIKIFNDAISLFLKNEIKNILDNVSERNLCGHLSRHLNNLLGESGLEGYYCDIEYNRQQNGEVKTILDNEMHSVNITCDIIIHSRGENKKQDNLLAVEMKKSNRPEFEKDSDKMRLRALTKDSYDNIWSNDGKTFPKHVCGYILGVYMEIDNLKRVCLVEFYEKGKKYSELSMNF